MLQRFQNSNVLTETEWRTVGEFEVILRDTSRLTTVCQNEDQLNGSCGPVMRKCLHDSLSSTTMKAINYDSWSSYKDEMHPTRREAHVDSFEKASKHANKEHCLNVKEDSSTKKLKFLVLRQTLDFV